MNERQKRDAKYTAAGTAAGAAFMPVRTKNNAKHNPFKDLPEGVHTVPMGDMHKIARKTGKRLYNRRYTARMAESIVDGKGGTPGRKDAPGTGLHKPAQVLLRPDGSARQSSGAHRLWAQTMAGHDHTQIEVHHVFGPRTTEPLYNRAGKDIGQAIQQRRLKRGAWGEKKIRSAAAAMPEWAAKKNEHHIGSRLDEVNPAKEIGPSTTKLRGRQAAVLAAGATAGLAASALRDSDKKQVSKRDITDEELRTRKKIQGKIGRTTSTMGLTGVAMLGTSLAMKKSPRFATKVATTPGLRRLGNADQIREKAQNLGLVAGGIGGIGGFNQARIYTEESKHKRLSKALSMESEHDMEPVYGEFSKKAFDTEEKKRGTAYGAVGGILGAPGAAAGSALAAPSGAKLQGAAAGAVGGFLGGPVGGGVAGHYAGSLHSRLKPLKRKKKTDITKSAFGVSHD